MGGRREAGGGQLDDAFALTLRTFDHFGLLKGGGERGRPLQITFCSC